MTQTLSPPPQNSRIAISYDAEDNPRLSWLVSSGRGSRWGAAAFFGFWLCGWMAGETFALTALLGMLGVPVPVVPRLGGGGGWFAALLLIVWLTGWTLGGAVALWVFYRLVRGPGPESVTLGPDVLCYDPGTSLDFIAGGKGAGQAGNQIRFTRRGPVRRLPWSELGPIRLDRVGGRQRLTVDYGADCIEIGSILGEPEREWLAAVLGAWAEGRKSAGFAAPKPAQPLAE
jgi:hypothetical protein